MPSGTFPTLGSYGYTYEVEVDQLLRIYNGVSYNRYLRNSNLKRVLILQFKGVQKTMRDSIISFHETHWLATTRANFEFYVYSPEETSVMTGSTGLHTGIFLENKVTFRRQGRCRWDGQTSILLLD
jgi:hypothetical protein